MPSGSLWPYCGPCRCHFNMKLKTVRDSRTDSSVQPQALSGAITMPNLQRRPLLGSALAAALLGAITLLPGWAPAASLPPYSLRTLPAAWEYVTAIDDQRNILGSLTIDGRSTTVVLRPDGTHWRPEEGLVSNPPEVVISVHSMNRHGQILLVYPFAVGPLRDSYNLNLEWGPFNRSPDGANVVVRLVVRDEKGARALPDFPVRLDSCRSVRGNINNAGTVAVNYEFWTGQFLDWEGWLQEDIRAKSMFYRPGQGWQHFATPPGLPQSVLHYLREDGTAVGVAFSLDIVIGNDGGQFLATTYAPLPVSSGQTGHGAHALARERSTTSIRGVTRSWRFRVIRAPLPSPTQENSRLSVAVKARGPLAVFKETTGSIRCSAPVTASNGIFPTTAH